MINIKDLNKGAVVAALYNAARPQGIGYMVAIGSVDMTEGQGADIFAKTRGRLDYVAGRSIKTVVTGDEIDPWRFDRDNGEGSCARAIGRLR